MLSKSLPETAREVEVSQAVNALGYDVDKLSDVVKRMRERLERVVREQPNKELVGKDRNEYQTPLAREIRAFTDAMEGNIDILQDYLSRLEI